MNAPIFIQQLKSCGSLRNPALAKHLHDQIRGTQYEDDRLVANLVVEMYGKCGQLDEAKAAFDNIKQPNVFSSTLLLTAYTRNGYYSQAKAFFDGMSERNIYSWSTLITCFGSGNNTGAALEIFYKMPAWNNVACNSVVTAYTVAGDVPPGVDLDQSTACNASLWLSLQNGDIIRARDLFEKMAERDIVSWNTLLQGYAEVELVEDAAAVFERMPAHNSVSCTSAAAALVGDFGRRRDILSSIQHWDVVSLNAKLQFLSDFGLIEQALETFEKMPGHSVVTLTSIVAAYAHSGYIDQAKSLFEKMPEKNYVTWNALLSSYAQLGHVEVAENMLGYLPKHSTMAWNSILKAHGDLREIERAKKWFDTMVHRNLQSWNYLLEAFAMKENLRESLDIFENMPHHDRFSWSILILTASNTGDLDCAVKLFDQVPYQDVLCWNALAQAYTHSTSIVDVLRFFHTSNLLGIVPNQTTFALVLTGLSHVGGVEAAQSYFVSMVRDHGIAASAGHYCCVVDVLGRAGQVKEAMDLVDNLPYSPMDVEWTTLLGASKTHGDYYKGVSAAEKLIELTRESAVYSLVVNICTLTNKT